MHRITLIRTPFIRRAILNFFEKKKYRNKFRLRNVSEIYFAIEILKRSCKICKKTFANAVLYW